MNTTLLSCAALGMMVATGAAQAQSAGSWLWKAGWNQVEPSVSRSQLSAPSLPNSLLDVKGAGAPIASLTYMYTANWSAEVFAGLPYEHDLVGAGAVAGAGTLGTVKQVAPTVMGQYRFGDANSRLRPYVGLGVSYVYFYGEKGSGALTALTNPGGAATRISVDAAWALSIQAGLSVKLGDSWFVDAAAIKTSLSATSRLTSGQTAKPKLDPLSISLAVGRAF